MTYKIETYNRETPIFHATHKLLSGGQPDGHVDQVKCWYGDSAKGLVFSVEETDDQGTFRAQATTIVGPDDVPALLAFIKCYFPGAFEP